MISQKLEQMLCYVPSIRMNNAYNGLEIYANGLSRMYTNEASKPGGMLPVDNNKGISDGPGQLSELYEGRLIERIDFSHDEPHVNYDLFGVKKKEQKDLFGTKSDFEDFHHKPLFKDLFED